MQLLTLCKSPRHFVSIPAYQRKESNTSDFHISWIRVVPVRRPVRMHKWSRDIGLQLDDGETQGGDSQAPRTVDGAVPFELRRGGQAELVGEVAPLVVVLPVLMFV